MWAFLALFGISTALNLGMWGMARAAFPEQRDSFFGVFLLVEIIMLAESIVFTFLI